MDILTLSHGGEVPLNSYAIIQDQKWQRFVTQVMASYDKHIVSGDPRNTLKLVRDDLNSRGHNTTSGSLYYVIREELKIRKRKHDNRN